MKTQLRSLLALAVLGCTAASAAEPPAQVSNAAPLNPWVRQAPPLGQGLASTPGGALRPGTMLPPAGALSVPNLEAVSGETLVKQYQAAFDVNASKGIASQLFVVGIKGDDVLLRVGQQSTLVKNKRSFFVDGRRYTLRLQGDTLYNKVAQVLAGKTVVFEADVSSTGGRAAVPAPANAPSPGAPPSGMLPTAKAAPAPAPLAR